MSSNRAAWQRVKDVFDEARALPTDRRARYLDQACGADRELRREVESLLASCETADDFLERPAAQVFDQLFAAGPLEGRTIGPYQIGARIGAGGMGEVYRALDTRLGRTVAIKVLPAHLATDPLGRERFEREARAVAALNHPHISTLYDVGAQDGINFLVMEFLEGETLAARLAKGPVPLAKALEYAAQIASALDKAHRAGIVHRDLKPGNVILTAGGAKLLDFGLAKLRAQVAQAGAVAPRELTGPGTILGTAQYMAPEQVEGKEADARSDLFAFGAVLHEMLTGKKAFDAPSHARLAAAILSSHPPRVSELEPGTPAFLDYLVGRCLAKDPDDRWQDARDLLAELERSRASLRPSGALDLPETFHVEQHASRAARTGRRLRVAIVGAVAVALTAATAYLLLSRPIPSGDVVWLSVLPPPGGFDLSPDPAISPNGQYVIYKAQDASHRTQIWMKSLRSSDAHPIPGTDGTDFTAGAFWSPDSRSVGFFAQGKLKRVGIDGASPQVLAAAPEPRGGTWSASGVIIFNADTQNLMRVSAAGGAASRIADPSSGGVRLFPHALPGGVRYLFTSRNAGGQGQGVYIGSLDAPDVRRVSDAWSPAVYASGHLLFARQGGLFAQPLDLNRQQVLGEPKQIADGVGVGYGTPLSFPLSASAGVVTYWGGSASPTTQLAWFDRSGKRVGVAGDAGAHAGLTVTQDGRRAALERFDAATATMDVWILDLQRRAGAARLTADGRFSVPVLTPSGDRLALMERGRGIVTMPVGGGATELMVAGSASKWPVAWSRDGHVLTFLDSTPTGWRIWTATDRGGSPPSIYRDAPFILSGPEISPDAKWLAYASDESGRYEVYVDSFPQASTRSRVSMNGGAWPKWRSDGKELYYLAPDRRLMASSVATGEAGLTFAPAVALFEGPGVNPDIDRTQFSPSPDGSRFLFNAHVEDPTPAGLTVIINWPTLVKK
jgi:serine/threonine protein kinase